MNKTIISWCDFSWNPTHGCSMVSEGCRNCYAMELSLRMGYTKKAWTKANLGENLKLQHHKLRDPYKLKTPSRVFVNSMSDLFLPEIPDDFRRQIFDVMADLPQHTFQILTKRPELMKLWDYKVGPNIWFGTSVEDSRVLGRVDHLRESCAQTRFISAEPLIGPLAGLNLDGINWVIVGGESGPHFRDMPHEWAREIRDLCLASQTAFFFKQSSNRFTERGTALEHEDGSFWKWEQYPDNFTPPWQELDQDAHNAQQSLHSNSGRVLSRPNAAADALRQSMKTPDPQNYQLPLFD